MSPRRFSFLIKYAVFLLISIRSASLLACPDGSAENILGFCLPSSTVASHPQPTPAYPPVLAPFGDGDYWVLALPLKYRVWKTQGVITIPRGFVTDLASVPQVFWSVLPKTGKYMSAAILHDFLYADQRCTKEQADLILKMEMELFGVSPAQSAPIYEAVRLFGKSAWESNKQLANTGSVRVIPSIDLDKYLTEDLDASKSWQAVKKGVEKNSLLMPIGKMYVSDSENEAIASVCADAVLQYSNAK